MMKSIILLYNRSQNAVSKGILLSDVLKTGLFEKVTKMKYDIPNDKPELFDVLDDEINTMFDDLINKNAH